MGLDGNNCLMNEWRELAELLVELDFEIEELDSFATDPEDVMELERQEELRDEIQLALRFHHVPRHLRRRLEEHRRLAFAGKPVTDPRD